jgi:hypothetical protein
MLREHILLPVKLYPNWGVAPEPPGNADIFKVQLLAVGITGYENVVLYGVTPPEIERAHESVAVPEPQAALYDWFSLNCAQVPGVDTTSCGMMLLHTVGIVYLLAES